MYTPSLGMTQVTNSIGREEFLSLLNNQTEELKNLKDELDKNIEEMINNYTQGTTSSMSEIVMPTFTIVARI